ncbi:hypothetical protein LQ567_16335 [Niabella pedocola]|uniref:TerB-C domain-containing protein n=1 Tax=Niabella pedocola TaxID=1752077 RepID=A0ABS8PTF5_9BACT|nr:hypothetical protein [Niabella pedocola]MCD2424349.1 hypothetical protein [Niabella pedocola]
MKIKQWLYSKIFVRNMLATFGYRSAYSNTSGGFTPYFSYRLGNYQNDFYLYFQKEPFAIRYLNEIFNKLHEYQGFDIINYLEFHYNLYPEKADFLRFLQYEINDRLKKSGNRSRKLVTALDWVAEKQLVMKEQFQEKAQQEQQDLKQELEMGLHTIIQNAESKNASNIDQQVKILSEKLSMHIDQIMKTTENGLSELTNSFTTGNIELNNRNHEERIVQLLILLQEVQAPSSLQKGEQLFKKFSDTDIAAILKLHFAAFKDRKINTLQKRVGDKGEVLNYKNPKVQQLIQALEEFFYH